MNGPLAILVVAVATSPNDELQNTTSTYYPWCLFEKQWEVGKCAGWSKLWPLCIENNRAFLAFFNPSPPKPKHP